MSCEYVSYSVSANSAEPIAGLTSEHTPLRFDESGRALDVTGGVAGGRTIERLEAASGEHTPWRVLEAPSPMGVIFVTKPTVTADGRRHAYSFVRVVSNLDLVEGSG
jgi:hypothetical protein